MAGCTPTVLLVLLAALSLQPSTTLSVTPVQQVLKMLTQMKGKGQERAEKENQIFEKYMDWVGDRVQELDFEIETSQNSIEKLEATIEKAGSDNVAFTEKAMKLKTEMEKLNKELEEATKQRASEHEAYEKTSEDLRESVGALTRAIDKVSAENYDRPQAEAYMQQEAASQPGMVHVLAAFLQSQQPTVDAYESQTSPLVKTLQDLLSTFKAQLEDAESVEGNQAHAFKLVELHIHDNLAYKKKDADKAETEANSAKALASKSKKALDLTKKELEADKALRTDIQTTSDSKKNMFNENQKVRKDELKAISEAIEIISSPAVSSFAQARPGGVVLLQSAMSKRRSKAKVAASEFLRLRAKALSSRSLETVANRVAAEGPFDNVIQLIEDLLDKLKDSASSEEQHKQWCDEELKKNKMKRDDKTSSAEQHAAEIEAMTSSIESQTRKIQTLMEEQASLAEAAEKATRQRQEEKAENELTIKDAKQGMEAVKSAMTTLKEFYGKQGTNLLQEDARQVPEMKEYTGMRGSSTGVIGMLEVVLSDFSRLKTDTEASENKAQAEYESFMADNEKASAQKHEDEVQTKMDKDQVEFDLEGMKDGLGAVKKELKMANKYFDNLKPLCMEIHVSFEERATSRQQEIEALNKAYDMLSQKGA